MQEESISIWKYQKKDANKERLKYLCKSWYEYHLTISKGWQSIVSLLYKSWFDISEGSSKCEDVIKEINALDNIISVELQSIEWWNKNF